MRKWHLTLLFKYHCKLYMNQRTFGTPMLTTNKTAYQRETFHPMALWKTRRLLQKVFKEFNKFCMGLKLFSKSYISIDGSKFKAVNAKDNNLTLSKLDDRIRKPTKAFVSVIMCKQLLMRRAN